MKTLETLRRQLEAVDKKLIAQVGARARIVQSIAALKKDSKRSVQDPAREAALVAAWRALARKHKVDEEGTLRVLKEVLALSRQQQAHANRCIAFQGAEGAFSHQAALALFPGCTPMACQSMDKALQQVKQGAAWAGVLPVENSTTGLIAAANTALLRHKLFVTGQKVLSVRHALLAAKKMPLNQIKTVFAHPEALAQCREFLEKLGATQVAWFDGAGAAEKVKKEPGSALLAGPQVASLLGLDVVSNDVQDRFDNQTKFWVVSHTKPKPTGQDTTVLLFTTKNTPGALHSALEAFRIHGVNLTALTSLPWPGRTWQFGFLTELEGHEKDKPVQKALAALSKGAGEVRMLGGFPREGGVAL